MSRSCVWQAWPPSRREFLKTSAAATATAILPACRAGADGDVEPGTALENHRKSIEALVGAIRKAGKQPVLATLALRGK